jgi:hypothetical protein
MDIADRFWSLSWILRAWADGLPATIREVQDLLQDPTKLETMPFCEYLPEEKNFELASGTVLFGRKRG